MNETQLSKSVKKMQRDVNALNAKLAEHAGDIGETTHGIPAFGQAGFMPFDFYEKNKALFVDRFYINNVDVSGLTPGCYYGSQLTGIPDKAEKSALALIDVTNYGPGRKEIIYRQAYANVAWTKTIHSPGTNPNSKGWLKQTSSNLLWQGSASAVGAVMTLTDLKSNYDFLQIIVEGIGHNATSQTFTTSRGVYAVTVPNIPDSGDINISNTEIGLDFGSSQTAVRITENRTIFVSAEHSGVVAGLNGSITAIIGVNF